MVVYENMKCALHQNVQEKLARSNPQVAVQEGVPINEEAFTEKVAQSFPMNAEDLEELYSLVLHTFDGLQVNRRLHAEISARLDGGLTFVELAGGKLVKGLMATSDADTAKMEERENLSQATITKIDESKSREFLCRACGPYTEADMTLHVQTLRHCYNACAYASDHLQLVKLTKNEMLEKSWIPKIADRLLSEHRDDPEQLLAFCTKQGLFKERPTWISFPVSKQAFDNTTIDEDTLSEHLEQALFVTLK